MTEALAPSPTPRWAASLNLFNPYVNAAAAKRIYDSQGVGAWHASHESHMGQARAAYLATKGSSAAGGGSGGGDAKKPKPFTRRAVHGATRGRAFRGGR